MSFTERGLKQFDSVYSTIWTIRPTPIILIFTSKYSIFNEIIFILKLIFVLIVTDYGRRAESSPAE